MPPSTIHDPVYLDANATTSPDPEVIEAMLPWLYKKHGNPHSTNIHGSRAALAVDEAVFSIAKLINCSPSELILTSGATESNNLALAGLLTGKNSPSKLVHSTIDHRSVQEIARYISGRGIDVEVIPVNRFGMIDIERLAKAVESNKYHTKVVSVIHGNNEIGVIQNVAGISSVLKGKASVLHADATQTVGKVHIDVVSQGIDLMSFSSHKIYGPAGIGALFVSSPIKKFISPIMHGGGQQQRLRPGTIPVFLAVGFGKACEIARRRLDSDAKHVERLAADFCRKLTEMGVDIEIFETDFQRVPGLRSIRMIDIDASDVLERVCPSVSISSGSACSSREISVSHVLSAIGMSATGAREVLRFGFGRYSTDEDVNIAVRQVCEAVRLAKLCR